MPQKGLNCPVPHAKHVGSNSHKNPRISNTNVTWKRWKFQVPGPKNLRISKNWYLKLVCYPFFSTKNRRLCVCVVFCCVCSFSIPSLFFSNTHMSTFSFWHLQMIGGIWKLRSEERMLRRVMHHTVEEDIARDLQWEEPLLGISLESQATMFEYTSEHERLVA